MSSLVGENGDCVSETVSLILLVIDGPDALCVVVNVNSFVGVYRVNVLVTDCERVIVTVAVSSLVHVPTENVSSLVRDSDRVIVSVIVVDSVGDGESDHVRVAVGSLLSVGERGFDGDRLLLPECIMDSDLVQVGVRAAATTCRAENTRSSSNKRLMHDIDEPRVDCRARLFSGLVLLVASREKQFFSGMRKIA